MAETYWDEETQRFINIMGAVETVLLPSGARTVQQLLPDLVLPGAKRITLFLNVTVASGTGGLIVTVQGKDPVSGTYYDLNAAPTAVIATGLKVYELGPGLGSASGGVTQSTNRLLPKKFRVKVAVGDASSYTYSLAMVVK